MAVPYFEESRQEASYWMPTSPMEGLRKEIHTLYTTRDPAFGRSARLGSPRIFRRITGNQRYSKCATRASSKILRYVQLAVPVLFSDDIWDVTYSNSVLYVMQGFRAPTLPLCNSATDGSGHQVHLKDPLFCKRYHYFTKSWTNHQKKRFSVSAVTFRQQLHRSKSLWPATGRWGLPCFNHPTYGE